MNEGKHIVRKSQYLVRNIELLETIQFGEHILSEITLKGTVKEK